MTAVALDSEHLAWHLDAARVHCDWMHPILLVDAARGCRRGEILALQWPDLDLVNGLMRVSKSLEQTKCGLRLKGTKNGQPRIVSLPASVVEVLRTHHDAQRKNPEMFGPDSRTDLDLVFAAPDGDYLKPDSVTAKACLIARRAGLKGVSLHTLRHSHGSQLLSVGVPLPPVSKRLGHSSVYVTATVYGHALTQDEITAAEKWDATMRQVLSASAMRKTS